MGARLWRQATFLGVALVVSTWNGWALADDAQQADILAGILQSNGRVTRYVINRDDAEIDLMSRSPDALDARRLASDACWFLSRGAWSRPWAVVVFVERQASPAATCKAG